MEADEYPAYRDYFVVDYAEEIVANFGYTLTKSRAIAEKELIDDLPQTVSTPDHVLLCIEKAEQGTIGYLWYQLRDDGGTAFIMDFVVLAPFRGVGYGKLALAALQTRLKQAGVAQIKLRVAYYNERALSLYKRVGFHITGFNMVKSLEQGEEK